PLGRPVTFPFLVVTTTDTDLPFLVDDPTEELPSVEWLLASTTPCKAKPAARRAIRPEGMNFVIGISLLPCSVKVLESRVLLSWSLPSMSGPVPFRPRPVGIVA